MSYLAEKSFWGNLVYIYQKDLLICFKIGYVNFRSNKFKRVKNRYKINFTPKIAKKRPKSRLYDVIGGSKMDFSEKKFFSKKYMKNFLQDSIGHFYHFLGLNDQNNQKQSFWAIFPYSPLYICLDQHFLTFAVVPR